VCICDTYMAVLRFNLGEIVTNSDGNRYSE
jgi:hypothetical protein